MTANSNYPQVQDEIDQLTRDLEAAADDAAFKYCRKMQPYEYSVAGYEDNAQILLSNEIDSWRQKSLDLISEGFAAIVSIQSDLGQSRAAAARPHTRVAGMRLMTNSNGRNQTKPIRLSSGHGVRVSIGRGIISSLPMC